MELASTRMIQFSQSQCLLSRCCSHMQVPGSRSSGAIPSERAAGGERSVSAAGGDVVRDSGGRRADGD